MEHPENSEEYKGLTVNKGIEQPSIVNPYLKLRKKPRRREFSVGEYVEGIVKGDVTVLSQAVTLVESVKPEHQAIAQEVIEKCLPYSGNSMRIGISGVPGAGKSTSIDVFGLHVLEKGGKLAVLAIDPSSERSKGSILGDKTRMEKLSVHPKSFIRPSPSAGSLGVASIQALLEGQRNVMIGIDDDKIVYVPFAKAIKNDKPIDRELVNVLHELSI